MTGFGIIPILFFAVFAIMLVFMGITIFRVTGTMKTNKTLPRISAHAKVVSRRTLGSVSSYTAGPRRYFMTFEYDTGDRAEYAVSEDVYSYFDAGDEGTITVRGTEFISFVI